MEYKKGFKLGDVVRLNDNLTHFYKVIRVNGNNITIANESSSNLLIVDKVDIVLVNRQENTKTKMYKVGWKTDKGKYML